MNPLRSLVSRVLGWCAGLAGAALLTGCDGLVNHYAFHPERSKPVPPGSLGRNESTAFIPTSDGETLETFFLRSDSSDRLIIYFPGNAGNIAQRLPELRRIAQAAGTSVLGVGYRGYGASSGKPGEAGLYLDGEAALAHATGTLGYPVERIILYGRSIGTTVAIHAGQSRTCRGIILITPLSTGRELASAMGLGWLGPLAGRPFDNVARAPSLLAPVLVLHGTRDEVIPHAHGRRLFDAVAAPKRFVPIEDGHHNDLEYVDPATFWAAITAFSADPARFIAVESPAPASPGGDLAP